MNLLFTGVQIIDPGSSLNKQHIDLLISDGVITSIGKNLSSDNAVKIDASGWIVSPGFFDMHASLCDPGLELKEDIVSGSKAAASGGFTGVACLPNTQPAIYSRTEVEYVINKSKDLAVDIRPYGSVSHQRKGDVITEIYDMQSAGALAFTDADHPILDDGLLLKSLMYVKPFQGLIIDLPQNMNLIPNGQMHEGPMSTLLGMPGIPAIAEEMMVERDLKLLEYSDSRLHLANISCSKSVALIREAKKRGLNITASVAAYNLLLDDSFLEEYESNYKVNPPLRSRQDIESLKEGIKDGTIDVINSNHFPHDIESKKCEYEMADFGMSCLESTYCAAQTALADFMDPEELIQLLSINPRKILGLEQPIIEEGENANLTFYNPTEKWEFTKDHIISRGKNNPFPGTEFIGRVKGIVNRNKWLETS